MAKRGDVLVAKRKLGFAAEGVPQHFVVVQSDQLRDLDTLLVVPLDAAAPHVRCRSLGRPRHRKGS